MNNIHVHVFIIWQDSLLEVNRSVMIGSVLFRIAGLTIDGKTCVNAHTCEFRLDQGAPQAKYLHLVQ